MPSIMLSLLSVLALGMGIYASISDFKGLKIPNYISIIIAILFLLGFSIDYLLGGQVITVLYKHVFAATIVFIITLGMFAGGIIGAGDSKLLSAFALWTGLTGLMSLIFWMACAGGLLGLAALYIRNKKPVKHPEDGSWIAKLQEGESAVPYGIAITSGAFIAFIQVGYYRAFFNIFT